MVAAFGRSDGTSYEALRRERAAIQRVLDRVSLEEQELAARADRDFVLRQQPARRLPPRPFFAQNVGSARPDPEAA
jgi:hypothetical protein